MGADKWLLYIVYSQINFISGDLISSFYCIGYLFLGFVQWKLTTLASRPYIPALLPVPQLGLESWPFNRCIRRKSIRSFLYCHFIQLLDFCQTNSSFQTVTLDGGEFRSLAGEFNGLRQIPEEMWDTMEQMIRGTNKKSKLWFVRKINAFRYRCTVCDILIASIYHSKQRENCHIYASPLN